MSNCDAIREGCSRASNASDSSCCLLAKDETRENSSPVSETEINGIQELNNYSFIRVLAKQGSYAKVLLAQNKTTRKLFTIKALRKDVVLSTGYYSSIKTEKKCLTLSAKHPFLIGMHSCFQTKVCLNYFYSTSMNTHKRCDIFNKSSSSFLSIFIRRLR